MALDSPRPVGKGLPCPRFADAGARDACVQAALFARRGPAGVGGEQQGHNGPRLEHHRPRRQQQGRQPLLGVHGDHASVRQQLLKGQRPDGKGVGADAKLHSDLEDARRHPRAVAVVEDGHLGGGGRDHGAVQVGGGWERGSRSGGWRERDWPLPGGWCLRRWLNLSGMQRSRA